MLIVADDRAVVEADLAAGRLLCPRCRAGVLGGWGCSRLRRLRTREGERRLRPRRGRCRESACGATHVLLPDVCLAGRQTAVEVIGEALLAVEGYRPVAERLGVPAETVREFLIILEPEAAGSFGQGGCGSGLRTVELSPAIRPVAMWVAVVAFQRFVEPERGDATRWPAFCSAAAGANARQCRASVRSGEGSKRVTLRRPRSAQGARPTNRRLLQWPRPLMGGRKRKRRTEERWQLENRARRDARTPRPRSAHQSRAPSLRSRALACPHDAAGLVARFKSGVEDLSRPD